HIDSLMDAVVLQGSNHLEPGAVSDVSQSRILVPAEVPLKYAAIGGAIEHSSPRFQLTHSRGCFPGVKLGHSPVVDVLPSAHRVREVDLPVVAFVYVGKRRRDSSLCHYSVSFAEKRFADKPDGHKSLLGKAHT